MARFNNGKARPEERFAHEQYFKRKKNTAARSGKIESYFSNLRFCSFQFDIQLSNEQQNEFPAKWTIDKEISRINSLNVGELVSELDLLCKVSPQNPLIRIYSDRLKQLGNQAWELLTGQHQKT